MCVFVSGSEKDLDNTLSLLGKIHKVRDFVIPVRDSLEKLEINGSKDTTLINPTMIKFIVENNPNFKEYFLYFEDFETYKIFIGTIVKEELSKRSNECFHKHISLGLGISIDFIPSELLSYFNSVEFPYNATVINYECTIYKDELECPVCDRFYSIKISGI
uniref:2'-5' RNA ligase n=1 Tax=Strongyloides venezuelensis TaxID=75913 RepID=A0A0K0G070_STRVS